VGTLTKIGHPGRAPMLGGMKKAESIALGFCLLRFHRIGRQR
jgi:hypothetical protein